MKNELPKHLQDKVAAMPEYSYGAHRVVVTLEDGTEIFGVFVAWAREIVKVGTSEEIPFDSTKIVSVRSQVATWK
jgi:hypothetical protein